MVATERLYTGGPDTTASIINSLSPADNATGIPIDIFNNDGATIILMKLLSQSVAISRSMTQVTIVS